MDSALINGSIKGGTGNNSGGIAVTGEITNLALRGDLEGGSSLAGNTTALTGFVTAGRIAQMTVGGDIKVGNNGGTGLADSAAIRANRDIQSLLVRGSILGDISTPAVIAAAGIGAPPPAGTGDVAIQRLVIDGDVSYLNILGGYGGNAFAGAPLGTPTNADAQIGSVVIRGDILGTNIVAGVTSGADGRFGTADDALITGQGAVPDDPTVFSTIARVVLQAAVQTNTDLYAIVAQAVKTVLVGSDGTPLELSLGRGNDNKPVVAGSNFVVREIAV
jgi:hypothetical protein